MTDATLNPFKIDTILNFVISLFPEGVQEDPCSDSDHTHNESKLDKAFRLVDSYGLSYLMTQAISRGEVCVDD